MLIGAVEAVVCKCTFETLVCVHTVVETGAFDSEAVMVVFKCAFEAAFEAFHYVRAVVEMGCFEEIDFECPLRLPLRRLYACVQ